MTAPQYERLSAPFRAEKRARLLLAGNRALTWACYVLYPLLLAALLLQGRGWDALRGLLVPGLSFGALSLVRGAINRPRPYETLDIDPIIHKDTRGKSMPSRHVFSIFVIAMTGLWILPPLGIVLLVLGAVLAWIRVVGGVHYPSDVAVGAAVGIACGWIGYWLI